MELRLPFVPLESLVNENQLRIADSFHADDFKYSTSVRGKRLEWLCLSRRLLWMACGHEYIEPECLDWIDRMPPGAVLYDIGASNGIFSMYAAACGLRVIAIEPDPMNYFLLSYNNYLNHRSSGTTLAGCYNLAISDRTAIGSIHMKQMELGGHEKILDKTEDVFGRAFSPEYSHPVLKYTLDDLSEISGLPPPKYLKIDVDGSEFEALSGGTICLGNAKSVFIELTDDAISSFAVSLFENHGFILQSKHQVQNYTGLFNCVFEKPDDPA